MLYALFKQKFLENDPLVLQDPQSTNKDLVVTRLYLLTE